MLAKYSDIEKDGFSAKTITKFCGEPKDGTLKKLTEYSFILYEVGQYEVALKMINCLFNLLQGDE